MTLLTIPAGIYRIRNRITGEVYIGGTVNIFERIKAHCGDLDRGSHHNEALQRAWDSYGRPAFAFSILEVTPKDADVRIAAENRWLDWARATTPGPAARRHRVSDLVETKRQCQEHVYVRDMLRYSGRGRGGFSMHYERRQCRNRPVDGSVYCWRHNATRPHQASAERGEGA